MNSICLVTQSPGEAAMPLTCHIEQQLAAQIDVSFSDRLSENRVSHVTAALLDTLYFPVTSVSSPFSREAIAVPSNGPSSL